MNMVQAIKKHKMMGGHFFDLAAMRFFGSIVETTLRNNKYFVTSESINGLTGADDPDRKYTIRKFENGYKDVVDIGEFQQYSSKADALSALEEVM